MKVGEKDGSFWSGLYGNLKSFCREFLPVSRERQIIRNILVVGFGLRRKQMKRKRILFNLKRYKVLIFFFFLCLTRQNLILSDLTELTMKSEVS